MTNIIYDVLNTEIRNIYTLRVHNQTPELCLSVMHTDLRISVILLVEKSTSEIKIVNKFYKKVFTSSCPGNPSNSSFGNESLIPNLTRVGIDPLSLK